MPEELQVLVAQMDQLVSTSWRVIAALEEQVKQNPHESVRLASGLLADRVREFVEGLSRARQAYKERVGHRI